MEDKKVLLKVEDLNVKFRVRGRILTAIRGISLDIYEGESIAIVGESGSGKSVFTKTFAGMLDSNGFIDQGRLIFNDEELADTVVVYDDKAKKKVSEINAKLDELSKYEFGAATYKKMLELESEKRQKCTLSDEEKAVYDDKIKELTNKRTNLFNKKQTRSRHMRLQRKLIQHIIRNLTARWQSIKLHMRKKFQNLSQML